MQPSHSYEIPPDETDPDRSAFAGLRSRAAWVLSVILVLILLVVIPPLINVSRFQHRIASNLSAAIGRPVHLDRVSLSLLPLPGFTLENFVVDEDPAFGYEPLLHAAEVRASVRLSSLWSRHVEFSRIALVDPTSVNLVRLPDGRWNFEQLLLQASHSEAAPTAQRFAGPAARFPYIEASSARINFKLGAEKAPLSLTDSDFALWLPSPRQWRFRLETHPARTDLAPSDTGVLRVEGTLGDPASRTAILNDVPIDLNASWDPAPVAGLSRVLFGRDLGMRGDITLNLHAIGSIGRASVSATLKLAHGRRADFIPAHPLALEARCVAQAGEEFQQFTGIECSWPPAESLDPTVLILAAAVPDVRNPESANATVTLPALRGAALLDWLQVVTPHPPSGFSSNGVLAGTVAWRADAHPAWSGELELSGESLQLGAAGEPPIPLGDLLLASTAIAPPATPAGAKTPPARRAVPAGQPPSSLSAFELSPVSLPLGGKQPATLEAHFDSAGYTLHLTGTALLPRLLALATAIPQLGEGLKECVAPDASQALNAGAGAPTDATSPEGDQNQPIYLDLTATRRWGQAQVWVQNPPAAHSSVR